MTDSLTGLTPNEPIDGVKLGAIVNLGDGVVSLAGIGGPHEGRSGDRLYGVDDTARCARGQLHRVPDFDCGCGFWAVGDRATLAQLFPYDKRSVHWVELSVESFGRVVVHDVGVRASRQRVLGVAVSNVCSRCGEHATRFAADRVGELLSPRCAGHLSGHRDAVAFTAHELAAALGTEVGTEVRLDVSELDGAQRRSKRFRYRFGGRFSRDALVVTTLLSVVGAMVVVAAVASDASPSASAFSTDRAAAAPVVAAAAAVVDGAGVADTVPVGDATAAVYPVVAGDVAVGAALFIEEGARRTCVVALGTPVPAFAAAVVGGDLVADDAGRTWLVSARQSVSAPACAEWVAQIEQTLARTR